MMFSEDTHDITIPEGNEQEGPQVEIKLWCPRKVTMVPNIDNEPGYAPTSVILHVLLYLHSWKLRMGESKLTEYRAWMQLREWVRALLDALTEHTCSDASEHVWACACWKSVHASALQWYRKLLDVGLASLEAYSDGALKQSGTCWLDRIVEIVSCEPAEDLLGRDTVRELLDGRLRNLLLRFGKLRYTKDRFAVVERNSPRGSVIDCVNRMAIARYRYGSRDDRIGYAERIFQEISPNKMQDAIMYEKQQRGEQYRITERWQWRELAKLLTPAQLRAARADCRAGCKLWIFSTPDELCTELHVPHETKMWGIREFREGKQWIAYLELPRERFRPRFKRAFAHYVPPPTYGGSGGSSCGPIH